MKFIKNLLCFIIVLIMVISLFSGCSKSDLITIRLNEVVRSIFYTPHYVAINKGFFEEEGIKIDLTTGQGADKTMTALLAGECDIGFAGPEACIYVYNQGKEDYAVIFAQLTKCDGSFLVAREPDPNFDWKKTAGKTIIGGRPGGVPQMTLEYILKKNGVIPGEDVEMITNLQFTATAGAFKGGVGDYVALFEPTASMLELENAGSIVASIGEDSGLIAYTAYFAKKSYIEKNPDIIQRFTNAIYKGQLWVQNNKAEDIAKEIKSFFPDADDEILVRVINRYKEIDAWNNTPISIPESFDLLQEVMETAGELDKRVDHSILCDDRFAKEAVKNIK
ncbi:MAG: ABC transporter substrate-binding protein [Clostridiales bacterium]|nr:ABC transporter substrate-binding protein [Clostridiales bacterium]